ncbi:MAG: PDZ domain-containing protein [Granulosicoccaceae bacterium]
MNKSIIAALCLLSVGSFSYLSFNVGQQSVAVEPPEPNETSTSEINKTDTTASDNTIHVALPPGLRAEIEQLRDGLNESKRERDTMREELTTLQDQLSNIQNNLEYEGMAIDEKTLAEPSNTFLPPGSETTSTNAFGFGRISDDERKSSLQAAGIDDQTIASIAERSDQFELARLELIDRATRDGDRGYEEFHEELEELEESRVNIREEIGDEAYDEYLINAGRDNRVIINSVINGSAASIAGIQTGDVIYSYAGLRIFTTREIQQATREGNRGEFIDIEVLRNEGEQQFYSIERGPMGVTLGSVLDTP